MKSEEIGEINKRLKKYREGAKLTQDQVAEKVGMKRNTYAHMERHGHPRPEMIKKLSEIFGVSVENILYGEIEKKSEPETSELTDLINRLNNNQTPQKLNEQPFTYDTLPFTPSATEIGLLKTFHILSKEEQKLVLDLVNKIYKK